ncbi:MAG: FtsX-like permease family protein, partial [Gemmatimonadaceae bacterium]
IPLVSGRVFSELDESPNVHSIIISASVAKGFWPNANPVGRTLHMPRDSAVYTVVGVVADVPHAMDEEAMMQVYKTNTSSMRLTVEFVIRSRLLKADLLRAMTSAVHSVDRQQAVFNLRMMDEVKSSSIAPRRTSTLFISAFALLALVLACFGVYAVVSYAVSNRSRELGIRSALGATGRNLAGMISREMVPVVAIGLSVGLSGAWMLSRMFEGLVYGVQVHDVMTFVLVPLALVFPAALATFIPARRVLRVNPADVMRAD